MGQLSSYVAVVAQHEGMCGKLAATMERSVITSVLPSLALDY